MDRKTLMAIALSAGVAWFWITYVMIPPAKDDATNRPTATQGDGGSKADDKSDATKADAKPDVAKPDVAKPDAPKTTDGKTDKGDPPKSDAPLVRQPETFSTVEIAGHVRATLSSWGAGLHDLSLTNSRFVERSGDHDIPIDLVASKDTPLPYSVTFPESGFELPADADFKAEPATDPNERRYSWDGGGVHIEKRWHFTPNTYEGGLDVIVENRTDKALPTSLRLTLMGRQDPDVQPSMFKPSVVQTEGLCSTGKVERGTLQALLKEGVELNGPVRMLAVDRKYFVLVAAFEPVEGTRCRIEASKSGRITVRATQPSLSIPAGGKHEWKITTFMGPKVIAELDAVKIQTASGLVDAHLGDVMNYGWLGRMTEVFARMMLAVLKAVHRVIGNYGVAIILLTLLIKLITWWPTAQSMKSAQAMAKLKPEMDKLKEKYGDDKARMNQEVMALYTKHKINPLGGCLPVLIQMPIYIALYSMLGNSVELYGAHFAWIHDLTAPEGIPPILPLCTGGLMFVQQRLSPAAVDPSQKTMMTMMPIMFTGMSLFLPAGLTLYILTNTALSILQQRISAPSKATPDAAPATSKNNKKKKAD